MTERQKPIRGPGTPVPPSHEAAARTVVVWRHPHQGLKLVFGGALALVVLWVATFAGNLAAEQEVVNISYMHSVTARFVTIEDLIAAGPPSVAIGAASLIAWGCMLIGMGLCAMSPDRGMAGLAVIALAFSVLGFVVWPLALVGVTAFLLVAYRGGGVWNDPRVRRSAMKTVALGIVATILSAAAIVPAAPAAFDEAWRVNFGRVDDTTRVPLVLYLVLWATWSFGYLGTTYRAHRVLGVQRVSWRDAAEGYGRPEPAGGRYEQ